MNPVPDAIPWYKSNVLRALLVGGVALGLKKVGLGDQFPDAGGIVDTALDGVQVGAGLWAAYARVKKPNPPVTMTQAAADAAASTPKSPLFVALMSLAILACAMGSAQLSAQTLKFTAAQTVNANGSVTPVLTWCTEGATASPGTTCAATGHASACTASGDWSGAKLGAGGTETLATITSSKSYVLACNWPGQDKFTVSWTPPTLNDDGTALTNLKGFDVYYATSPTVGPVMIDVPNAGATSQVVGPGLAPGSYYVQVDAYSTNGILSKKSPVTPLVKTLSTGASVTQSVMVKFPNPPTNVTIQ